MGQNQTMQTNPREQFVQLPLDIEHSSTTPIINQTSDSKRRHNNWLTIIICIIFTVTGQSLVRLLENYYYLHRNQSSRYGRWTRSLVQVVGLPILVFPFLLLHLLSSKKHNQLPITSDRTSLKYLAIMYPIIGIIMAVQAIFSTSKQALPFKVFTVLYTTQLLFTPVICKIINKIKFNRWMIISIFFAILTGSFTLYTFSAGSPDKYNSRGVFSALYAAFLFSLLLSEIMITFDDVISKRNESTNRKPSFAAVLELLIFSSLLATVFLLVAVFISGEHRDLKKAMDGFSKGENAYVRTMVGLVIAWQVYWVGVVGLVFSVSAVFSNVISVCTWPVVSLLVALFYNKYEEYHVLSGTAFATAALSIASYFYLIHKENATS